MDNRNFDELARSAAHAGTRRGVLRVLSGGTIATILTRFAVAEAEAKPKKKCTKRKKIGQKCKLNNGAKCKCRGGAQCKGGRCKCPAGTEQNGARCVQPTACLENRTLCFDSEACCSEFCGTVSGVNACCVPNDEICDDTSDCCETVLEPAACEAGRCCIEANGRCATPNGTQVAECCGVLECATETTQTCLPSIAP